MKKVFIALSGFMAVMILAGLGVGAVFYYHAVRELPDYKNIADYRPALVTSVLARDGSLMGQLYREKRFPLTFEQVPEKLRLAFLAVEDADFYSHDGVNPTAILRAFIMNMQSGKTKQGGSTITQQLIKQLLLTPERKYKRKLQEAVLAYRLESYLSKNEILTIYLNHIFLGSHSYGVEAAARTYFGKHVSELTLAESALIAGMPQAPSAYNPYRFPDAARKRQMHVLNRMRECNWITQAEHSDALAQPLAYKSMEERMGPEVDWYFEEVRRQLIELFTDEFMQERGLDILLSQINLGLNSEALKEDAKLAQEGPKFLQKNAVYMLGLTVETAMDPSKQLAADRSLKHGLEALSKRQGWAGPIRTIAPQYLEAHVQLARFTPTDLMADAWVEGIVTGVDEKGADVSLGQYKGRIGLPDMSWARTPNPKVAGIHAPAVKDAAKVLNPGDVIWVSTNIKNRKQPYAPGEVTPETVIPLALEQQPEVQGALISMEPETGDTVALVGGYSFADSHFNRATQAKRQPGSSFKPIVYSAAMDNGFTAGSVILDAPVVDLNEDIRYLWRPSNYSGGFKGPILLRTALTQSRNLCTIRVAQQVGIPKIIERAKDLGLETEFPEVLSIALGAAEVTPINLTEAYTAFANQGLRSKARLITRITDSNGQVLYEREPDVRQAVSPQNAFIMASLLKDVVNAGTATRAKVLNRPVGGKTGTTNEEMDAWFMGITPHLVTGVFVGFDKLKTLGRLETGGSAALPIFVEYGKQVLDAYPPDDFTAPEGIAMAKVDPRTGLLVGGAEAGFVLPFATGTEPVRASANSSLGGSKSGEDLLKNF